MDSSVWIDYFRAADTPQTALLDSLFGRRLMAIGNLIAAEVLQGVRDEKEFQRVKSAFEAFEHIELAGYDLAVKASQNHRYLRGKGITIRKTIDTIIATRCIESDLSLLHSNLDFQPFHRHLGLRVAYQGA